MLAVAPKNTCRSNEVFLNVYGVGAQVVTPLEDFADFVRRNYGAFLDEPGKAPLVKVVYSPEAGERAAAIARRLSQAGMGLRLDRTRLYWENEFGFRVLVTLTDTGDFEILAFHHDLLRARDAEARYRNFQRSLRWAVHFPIFVQLRARLGWTLMHASAVAGSDGALVLCGLNKVGKSTLAMYLCRHRGYRFMTDNFLFAAGDAVHAFPEVVRLPPQSLERLGMEPPPPPQQTTVYGKHHVTLDSAEVCLKAQPKAFFLITLGERVELTPLEAGDAWRRVEGLHAFLGEFPDSSYLAMLPFLERGSFALRPQRPCFPSPANWYHLTYTLNWNLEHTAEVLEGCI